MTDVREAKRAVERLADPAPVVDGERALRDVLRAAAFVDGGGLTELRRVAETGDDRWARRAREVLSALTRFRRAAARDGPAGDASDDIDGGSDATARRYHFRAGRDTHLPGAGEPPADD